MRVACNVKNTGIVRECVRDGGECGFGRQQNMIPRQEETPTLTMHDKMVTLATLTNARGLDE